MLTETVVLPETHELIQQQAERLACLIDKESMFLDFAMRWNVISDVKRAKHLNAITQEEIVRLLKLLEE